MCRPQAGRDAQALRSPVLSIAPLQRSAAIEGEKHLAVKSSREITAMPPPDRVARLDEQGYAYQVATVGDAIERAVSGEWDMPEFQRKFVWKPSQACDLADSLWRNYPIGPLLLWRDANRAAGSSPPQWWIADGQQRLTSLCLLCGREPAWLRRKPADMRRRLREQFDFVFDIGGKGPPGFVLSQAAAAVRNSRLVSVRRLTAIDPGSERGKIELEKLAAELKTLEYCRDLENAEIYDRLIRVSLIRQRELVATLVCREREQVLDIFERLNSRGMRFRRLLLKLAMEDIPAALRDLRARR